VDVATPLVRIQNRCVTRDKGPSNLRESVRVEKESLVSEQQIGKWRRELKAGAPAPALDQIIVSGTAARNAEEWVAYKNATHPEWTAAANLVEFLAQRGIKVQGALAAEPAPKNARVLARAESKPIAGVVSDMNKWSSNYVAEMLTKSLSLLGAASDRPQPGNMKAGLENIRGVLREDGVSEKDFVFLNAAGFSRENRVAPGTLGRLLVHWQSDFRNFPELAASLPTAGVDGTLRSRFQRGGAVGWVRAKTGLLNGVVGLAGYAGRADGEVLSFALIFNGPDRNEAAARQLFDQLASTLVQADN
jgi:D-alanyl-D-alanine carboxypeptidase/D-alanyl-D-alanine-endopeptidase (penicillin-binding protein 4)